MTNMSSNNRPSRPYRADIELTASVKANQLRFDESPQTEVRFSGQPDHESAAGSDRTNLPERVDPGVTYRDIRVDYRLASRVIWPAEPAGEQRGSPRPKE